MDTHRPLIAAASPEREVVLHRDAASIRAALGACRRGSVPLRDQRGQGAILKFLRQSLRVYSVRPESPRDRTTYKLDTSRALSQHAAGDLVMLAAGRPVAGEGSDSGRRIVDNLERVRHRDDRLLDDNRTGLQIVYLGAVPRTHGPQRVRHSSHGTPEWVKRCWTAILLADDSTLLLSFVDAHFPELLQGAPEDAAAHTASHAAPPSPPAARSHAVGPPPHDNVLALDSIKSREAVMGRFVPSERLPTRRAQLALLSRCASVSPARGIKASHCLAVVAGPHGVGKSEFINEWLLAERDHPSRRFDDVLYLTACSSMTEDSLVQQVRDYLAVATRTPLVVLDGLRTRDGEFAWDSDPARDADPSRQTASLAGLLTSLIGERTFVAVLGVQSLSRGDTGVPRGLSTHPRNRAVAIADLVRLEPLAADEARTFATVLLGDRASTEVVDAVVRWSNGLPLRLALAADTPQAIDADVAEAEDRPRDVGSGEPRDQLRRLIAYLDRNDGEVCAAMRVVSLFRRPQLVRHIDAVLRQVIDAGQPIGRIPRGSIREIVRRSNLFSWDIEGAVELHDAVRHVVEEHLARAIAADPALAQEARAIHLVAAHESFKTMRMRVGPEGAEEAEAAAAAKQATQYDLELACDCAYHLLGTRKLPGRAMALDGSADRLGSSARKVFGGEASDDEVDRFCYGTILRRAQLNGNAFS